jgi:hypothetical protein
MKIRSFVLATAIVSAVTGFAFAQTPAANPDTGNLQPGANSNSKAVPADQTMKGSGTMNAPAQTTGSNTKETKEKDASPASPASGLKQEK